MFSQPEGGTHLMQVLSSGQGNKTQQGCGPQTIGDPWFKVFQYLCKIVCTPLFSYIVPQNKTISGYSMLIALSGDDIIYFRSSLSARLSATEEEALFVTMVMWLSHCKMASILHKCIFIQCHFM